MDVKTTIYPIIITLGVICRDSPHNPTSQQKILEMLKMWSEHGTD